MPPRRYTMCFVYREKGDLQVTEEFHILLLGQRFGSDIQHFCMTVEQVLMDCPDLFLIKRGIQEVGDAVLAAVTAHQVYLVFLQADQRTEDDRYSFADNGGSFLHKTFSTTPYRHNTLALFLYL